MDALHFWSYVDINYFYYLHMRNSFLKLCRVFEVEVKVNLRTTVSRPFCPGVKRPSFTRDQFFFLFEIIFKQLRLCYFVAPSLMRGRVYNLL
jgi:hypothetical protein